MKRLQRTSKRRYSAPWPVPPSPHPPQRPKTKKSFPEILLSNLADFKSVYLLALDKVGNKEYNELNADWVASRIHRGKNCMEVAKEVFKDGEVRTLLCWCVWIVTHMLLLLFSTTAL